MLFDFADAANSPLLADPAEDYLKRLSSEGETSEYYKEKLEKMRVAGKLAAQTLDMLTDNITEGVSTDYIDKLGYEFIRDNGGWNEWVMIAIQEYPCNSKRELLIKERYYIDLLRLNLTRSDSFN